MLTLTRLRVLLLDRIDLGPSHTNSGNAESIPENDQFNLTTEREQQSIGNQPVRVARDAHIASVDVPVPRRAISVRGLTSPMSIIYGFIVVDLIGASILMLPISSVEPGSAGLMTALFTASSAITVTGLTVVDSDVAWTMLGQGVIISLMFVGGLGFMTGAAFLVILLGQELGLSDRLLVRTGLGGGELGGVATLVKRIALFAIAIQLIAFVAIFTYWTTVNPPWEGITTRETLWHSLFHAVSAFNNAGFDILPDDKTGGASVSGLRSHYGLMIVTMATVFIGGTGYIIWSDILRIRGFKRLRLDTKLVVIGAAILIPVGIGTFLLGEWSNPLTSGNDGVGQKFIDATFHTLSTRTAGFAVVDYAHATGSTDLSTEVLMFIGGASGSVAGGIKINTFMVVSLTLFFTLTGRSSVKAFGRNIPAFTVQRGLVVALVSVALLVGIIFALSETQGQASFREVLFESASAFGTVGLSTGITPDLTTGSRIVIILAMFIGRFGPLTLGLLMVGRQREDRYSFPEEDVRIG